MEHNETLELMANEVINFLKKKKLWDTNTGIIYNGKHVTGDRVEDREENLAGVMRIWYEGPLAKAIDRDTKVFNGIDKILNKYGYYLQPYSYVDSNVYAI